MRSGRHPAAKVSPAASQGSSRIINTRRRGFLLALGAGGAGAAAIAARSLTGGSPSSAESEAGAGDSGYRLTDHVKRYYQTAKL